MERSAVGSTAGATLLLLRPQPNIRIEPVPALGPRFHERAPHRGDVAGKGQLEVDRFLAAELCFGGMRRVGVRIDELLPGSRGAGLPSLLERLLVVGAAADARQRFARGIADRRSARMRL